MMGIFTKRRIVGMNSFKKKKDKFDRPHFEELRIKFVFKWIRGSKVYDVLRFLKEDFQGIANVQEIHKLFEQIACEK